jgi:hypothetical protein
MAGADAGGRCGGRGTIVALLALALGAGCSAVSASQEVPTSSSPPTDGGVTQVAATSATAGPASGGIRAPQTATRVERVTIESAAPVTRVILVLDGTAEPQVALLADQRLVIDVPQTTCASVPKIIEAEDDANVARVRTGEHGPPESKSRIVVDLRRPVTFAVRGEGRRLVAELRPSDGPSSGATTAEMDGRGILFAAEGGTAGEPAAPAAPPPEPPPAVASAPPEPIALTTAIEATPTPVPLPVAEPATPIAAPEPTLAADVEPTAVPSVTPPVDEAAPPTTEGTLHEAPPAEPSLPEPAAPPLPTSSPQPSSDPTATPPGAPPANVARDGAPHELGSADARLPLVTADPGPVATPASAPAVAATRAASRRVSIDFNDADVRTVIQLIASAGGYQVMFTPDVGGTITISLVDRPWEDALATVLRAQRLREVREADVMLVSPGR